MNPVPNIQFAEVWRLYNNQESYALPAHPNPGLIAGNSFVSAQFASQIFLGFGPMFPRTTFKETNPCPSNR